MILTDEHQMIRDALRTFSQERLAPNAARWDREHHFPKEELKELAALGAFGVAVPEHLGGAGLDYVALALVLEEIAAGDGGTSTIISVNNCPVCSIAMMYANDAQKEQWLRPLARGEMLGAFALTEPHTGSDASALRTTAIRSLFPVPADREPFLARLDAWLAEADLSASVSRVVRERRDDSLRALRCQQAA